MSAIKFSVFTKPWKEPLDALGERVSGYGFDGIELPVRPGYPITPETVQELPGAVARLKSHGVAVFSIAGPTTEAAFAACAEAGVKIVRVMAPIGVAGYTETERQLQKEFDALLPLLEKHGVTLGVQNHSGRYVSNACGMRALVGKYDSKHIAIVWDAAHNALNGEEMEFAIDIVWNNLCMVNLKNAVWKQANGPEAETATFNAYWTDGPHGLASWRRVVAELQHRQYSGVVCLTAEYTEESLVEQLIVKDLKFARSLFKSP